MKWGFSFFNNKQGKEKVEMWDPFHFFRSSLPYRVIHGFEKVTLRLHMYKS